MDEGKETPTTTPPPTFDDLALSPELRRAIEDLGYTHPTPVQREVFEPARRGIDLVVQARTGTGKTAAFGMPIIDSLVRRGQNAVQAVILCPTRELALQVSRELEALGKYRGVKPVAVYGGAPMPRQVEQIRAGAQVLVGTPGRVLDHLQRGTLDVSQVRLFVLDESDEMLSMGFLPQIDQIQTYLPESRQTLLFSATLPPDIQRLAETRLRNPEFLTLSGDHIGALEITHLVYLSRGDKLAEFIQLLEVEDPESAIVFCNTRDETKRVASALQQQGYAADWLNADLAQPDREKVMAATRGGELRFLVCTDVAARGIDISHLTHVINFDYPEAAESYVHRTGRTGRAGRTGTAISLVAPSDIGNLYLTRLTYKIRTIERQLPSAREIKTRAEADLIDMFVQAFATRPVHADDMALARRLLTHEAAELVIAGLIRDHLGARPDAQEEASAARHSRRPREADALTLAEAPPRCRSRSRARDESARADVTDHRVHPVADDSAVRHAEPSLPEEPARDTEELPTASSRPRQATAASEGSEATASDPSTVDARERERRPRRARFDEGRGRREPRAPSPAVSSSRRQSDRGNDEFEFAYTVSDMKPEERIEKGEEGPALSEAALAQPEAAAECTTADNLGRLAELYINVGRQDGASATDFETALAERAGITRAETGYIRVRNRHTFVAVPEALFERAQNALDGAEIAGKSAVAEPARPRT